MNLNTNFEWLALIATSALGLVACVSTPPRADTDSLFQKEEFHAPLGAPLTAQTGDAIFVDGTYIEGEVMALSQDVQTILPGSLHIPFPVSIRAGELSLQSIQGGWKYFCAKEGDATASFPGLWSVIAHGDCVGVRQSLTSGKLEWVVDNSNYNLMNTIWLKGTSESDRKLFKHALSGKPFSVRELTRIVYDGYYGQQFHFTYEVWTAPATRDSKEFVFDYDPSGETEIGIHGKVLRITAVNNVQMTYAWTKN